MNFNKIKEKYDEYLEKYTKKFGLDLKYFLYGGFWIFLNEIINFTRGFVISILFANFLSKETYGEYTFILTLLSIAMLFALPGIPITIIRSLTKNFDGTYKKANNLVFKWSFLGSLLIIFVGVYSIIFNKNYNFLLLLILSLFFPLYAYTSYYHTVLHAKKEYKVLFISNIIFTIFYFISILIPLFFSLGIFYIIIMTTLSHIFVKGYFHFYILNHIIKNDEVDEKGIFFGKKISASRGFSSFLLRLDPILITYFLGFQSLAIYTIVTMLPSQFRFLFKTTSPLFLQKFSTIITNKKKLIIYFIILAFIAFLTILIFSISSKYIFMLFYPEYLIHYKLSILFSLSLLVIPGLLLQSYFQAELSNKFINFVELSSSGINLILILILIQHFGLIGVIISNIISRIYISIMFFLFLLKKN